jgi:hypothetical protein
MKYCSETLALAAVGALMSVLWLHGCGGRALVEVAGGSSTDAAVPETGASDATKLDAVVEPTCEVEFSQTSLPVGERPQSLAIADLNGDGRPDVAVANAKGDNVSVLISSGHGAFESQVIWPAGKSPGSLVVADFDGDGDLDIATASCDSQDVVILVNDGNAGFAKPASYPIGACSRGIVAGDLNQDGRPDVVVVTGSDNGGDAIAVLRNVSGGFATPEVTSFAPEHPSAIDLGDANGDGIPDLAVGWYEHLAILVNSGDGSFGSQTSLGGVLDLPYKISFGDLNADGLPDLRVDLSMDWGGSEGFWINQGNGTFVQQGGIGSETVASSALADFNADGWPDVAIAAEHGLKIAFNKGGAEEFFGPQMKNYLVSDGLWSVAAADLNGDGRPDVAVTDMGAHSVHVLLNQCH